ncbi:MAG: NAD(P)-dependent oxidoreductase [Pseudomonadota bacterium]
MKILLAGGQSLVAQALKPALQSFAEVLTAGRHDCDVELDLTWPAERFALPDGVDAVINLAAHFGGPEMADFVAAEEVNALGALKLAHACVRSGVRQIVQVSSIFAGLQEDSPFYNSYALSKRHAEEWLRLYARQTELRLTILRPSQIYGEGEGFRRHQPMLYALLDQAQRGDDIVLNGSNDAQRNFIHIEDVAEIVARVARQRIEGCYDCVSLSNVRLSEIAAAAISAAGSSSTIRFDTGKPDISDNGFAADETLYRLIDYYPRILLSQGLMREVDRRKGGRA